MSALGPEETSPDQITLLERGWVLFRWGVEIEIAVARLL
jgi:hypothetical protein